MLRFLHELFLTYPVLSLIKNSVLNKQSYLCPCPFPALDLIMNGLNFVFINSWLSRKVKRHCIAACKRLKYASWYNQHIGTVLLSDLACPTGVTKTRNVKNGRKVKYLTQRRIKKAHYAMKITKMLITRSKVSKSVL